MISRFSEDVSGAIKLALKEAGVDTPSITIEHPADIKNGDYSTNVALVYSKQLGISPRELAIKIVDFLNKILTVYGTKIDTKKKSGILKRTAEIFTGKDGSRDSGDLFTKYISAIEIAGPGFINFRLKPEFFIDASAEILKLGDKFGKSDILAGKKIVIEYTDPNPFKIFHIGHLMSNAIGESISRLIEARGAQVIRANYQGDVGLHVAKAMWGMLQDEAGFPEEDASIEDMIDYISKAYVMGSEAYENEDKLGVKEEITLINKMIFDRSNPKLMKIYNWGRKVSLLNFEIINRKLGTKFDQYFFESEVAPDGVLIVRDFLKRGVFAESEGAVIFKGEDHKDEKGKSLHTRVFITSQGLPTYETKEVGLTRVKFDKYNPDLSIVITASEQDDYFKVVKKALSIMFPYMEAKMKHVSHGMLRFASGKMSSRTGNVITGESLLSDMSDMVKEKMANDERGDRGLHKELGETEMNQIVTDIAVGAIKYSILKQAAGSDIIYDFDKSISFEGDSGPYLQYSCVRARAVVAKAGKAKIKAKLLTNTDAHGIDPTLLEKLLYRYPEVVARAGETYEPHHVVSFLVELSASFNNFYANNTIIDVADKATSAHRVAVTQAFVSVMENGLKVLGIRVPMRM